MNYAGDILSYGGFKRAEARAAASDETPRLWAIPKGASRGVEVLGSLLMDTPGLVTRLHAMLCGDALASAMMLERILDGDVVPDSEMAEVIGEATDGKVTEAMFHERGLWPVDVPDAPTLADGAAEAQAVAAAPLGVLGETPAGPLFSAQADAGGQAVEVHGLGLSFRLGRSAAVALYAALGGVVSPMIAAGRA